MKILILTEWFDPEPTLKGLAFAKALASDGNEVEVLTGFPNYPGGKVYDGYKMRPVTTETIDGIRIHRVASFVSHDRSVKRRMFTYLSFALSAAAIGPWRVRRPDVLYVYHPPLTISIPAFVLKTVMRCPAVYEIQDLWPDTLAATGMVADGKLTRLIASWAKRVYGAMDRIIVLSDGFKSRLIERGVPPEKVRVIHNWNEESRQSVEKPNLEFAREWGLEGKFNVVFAGALGPAQALDTVLDSAKLCRQSCPNAQFVFIGSGFEGDRLKTRVATEGIDNVRFVPQQPMTAMGGIFPLADALLVHLRNEPLFSITIPSKTQAYLFAGRPIVMAVSGNAADLVRAAGAGPVIPPEDPAAMAEAVRSLYEMAPEQREALGANGRLFYETNLSMRVGMEKYLSIFRELGPRAPGMSAIAERTTP